MENAHLLYFETFKDYRNNLCRNINNAFFATAVEKNARSFNTCFQDFRSEKPTLSFLKMLLVAKLCELNFIPFPTIHRLQFE